MRRTLAILVATAAAGVPAAAEAVTVCRSTGGINPVSACVSAELNGDGDTVAPEVSWTCRVGMTAACAYRPVSVGKTGVDAYGNVWVAGRVIL